MSANGVWDSHDGIEITVRLELRELSPQEYFDEILEEFYRLQRLGHFASAKQFFEENLREHIEEPRVLMAYVENLLEQGDYDTLSKVDDDAMRRACDNLVENDDMLLLTMYWKLIKELTTYYKPYRPRMPLARRGDVPESINGALPMEAVDERDLTSIEDIIDKFRVMVTASGSNVSSTEVSASCGFLTLWNADQVIRSKYSV